MEPITKWLTGITIFAIVGTVFSSQYSPAIFKSLGSGIGSIYQGAGRAARGR